MFKYLLFGAMETVLTIFNSADAVPTSDIQELLKEANAKAAPLWKDKATPFTIRQAQCKEILDPVVRLNLAKGGKFEAVPSSVVNGLNTIYEKFYSGSDALLLIGQTDERAYKVQDEYGRAVASLLGTVGPDYESRATTCLQQVYGKGSLPLLCTSSASGMWKLCASSFYRRQTSLVSSPACCADALLIPT